MLSACRVVATDSAVQGHVKKSVVLLFEISVGAAVERELPSLSEGLGASVNAADEGLLVGVRVLMLSEILGQREHLVAKLTGEGLLSRVDVVVALEREFCCETLATGGELTLVDARCNLDALGPSE